MTGKTAVIIGGGGVLAGEMARGLAAAGAAIVIVDVIAEKAQARVKSLSDAGYQAVAVAADATNKAALESALKLALSNFGRVDILLNAAGINSGTPFFEIREAEWLSLIHI